MASAPFLTVGAPVGLLGAGGLCAGLVPAALGKVDVLHPLLAPPYTTLIGAIVHVRQEFGLSGLYQILDVELPDDNDEQPHARITLVAA